MRLLAVATLLLNLLLLPLVALCPPIIDCLLYLLARLGRCHALGVDWAHFFLLQTPAIKFLLACMSQVPHIVVVPSISSS